jgi:hypothetical protein
MSAVCSWPILTCGATKLDELEPEVREEVEAMAIDMLWNLTGQRFGQCAVTVRPCRRKCYPGDWSPYWPIITRGSGPLLDDTDVTLTTDTGHLLTDDSVGYVIGAHCGRCRGECGCTHVSEVLLPSPILEVQEVLLDGESLDLTAVRVDDYARLVRLDGEWPWCQDLNVADNEVGAWAITYIRGEAVPAGGGLIAGSLAIELAKAFCNDKSCRLPKRVNTIDRQGITIAFIDNFRDLEAGRTGVWEVDSWVANQNNRRTENTVNSPDLQTVRRTTWTASPSS